MREFARGGVVVIIQVATYLVANWQKWIKSVWPEIGLFLVPALIVLLIFAIWDYLCARHRLWQAAHDLHNEHQSIIDNKERHICEMELDLLFEREMGDMPEEELIAYALKHSDCQNVRDIEIAIRRAALDKDDPIRVSVQPNHDSNWWTVKKCLWKQYDIALKHSDSDEDYGYIFRMLDPSGESFGESPYFFREEIEHLWPPKTTNDISH